MNKSIYQLMSIIVAFALIFGSYSSAGASSESAPQMAATTYYVSASGNDANAGTSSAPFKTIQKCLNLVQPGGTCQILGGTYNERITISKNDTTLEAVGTVNTMSIYVTGSNNIIRGFRIKDPTSNTGLRVSGNFNVFESNEVSNTMQDGVWFFGHDNVFRNNYIHDILDPSAANTNNGDPHVDCFQTWDWNWDTYNVLFENNICDHTRTSQSNQIVMLSGSRVHDLTFRNNRFIMHDAGYSPVALYGGTGFVLENNYICNTTGAGSAAVYLSGASGVTLKNNNYAGYSSFVSGGGITSQTGTVKGSLLCVVFPATGSPTPTAFVQPSITPTASSVPTLPTSTVSVQASITPTLIVTSTTPITPIASPVASSVPASPTSTASVVAASPTPTASSVPALPTSTSVQPSATPIAATPTASAVPVLPTSTSVQPTAPAPQQSQPASETIYDDKHNSFVYSSDWRDVSLTQASGGSFKKTNEDGSSVTFKFTGQSFSVIYTSSPAYGKVKVYIDGQLVGTIDEKGKASAYKKRWNYPSQLTLGQHTLKLVVETPNGSIDAVIVR